MIDLASGAIQHDVLVSGNGQRLCAARSADGQLRQHGRLRQQAEQVQRATGFGAGARQAFATKRLYAHDGTHNVAVHVNIASVDTA